MPSYGGAHGPDGSKKTGDQGQGTRDKNGGNTGGGRSAGGSKKPGDAFGKWSRRLLGAMIPGLGGTLIGGGMLVGDAMGDAVQDIQNEVDSGRLKSKRKDTPEMGRVDMVDGRSYSFGNPAADDRAPNTNGLGSGMTGGGGGGLASENLNEERRRRRLAAQQTALGTDPNSLLGDGVLPI